MNKKIIRYYIHEQEIIIFQAGFAFLEAGSVRSKNITNILIKNFSELVFGITAYLSFGYAFAFGKGNSIIGLEYFGLATLNLSSYSHAFFQVYRYREFHDFAGSGMVHLSGGIVALVGAIMLGPRIGRFRPNLKVDKPISGHSIPLVALGALILIFGFMAFNGGSKGSITNPGDGVVVARAVLTTLIACCIGGGVVLFIYKLHPDGVWSLTKVITYFLMVSGIAGCCYVIVSKLMVRFKIDDPVDAVAVHFVGGLLGMLLAPIFMDDGLLYGATERASLRMGWNALGVLVLISWNGVAGILIFGILKKLNLFRANPKFEVEGLDIPKHGEPAYPFEAYIEETFEPSTTDVTQSFGLRVLPEVWAQRRKSFPNEPLKTLSIVLDSRVHPNQEQPLPTIG
ncbi:putative ammonium transporter 1 [Eurytemora carolleeae]|uniref:putative ammonium transporter 1 n=1 Tax=Eurytemora carolleeae TaxID=1294199 RepID=UPI000C75ADB5|nr:putative ammonium transporter 1 [Eurytemora carolleeae]|eukprot:XP_023345641.1 putative ammonium transporter 1 [Eurytemora affinis]